MNQQNSLFERKPRIENPTFDITQNRHGGNTESAAANEAIADSKENSRWKVYEYALSRGEHGVTTDEVAEHFDVPPNAVSGRLTELKALHKLVRTEQLRKTRSGCSARVFVAVGSL